jgi:hypothetical protein
VLWRAAALLACPLESASGSINCDCANDCDVAARDRRRILANSFIGLTGRQAPWFDRQAVMKRLSRIETNCSQYWLVSGACM